MNAKNKNNNSRSVIFLWSAWALFIALFLFGLIAGMLCYQSMTDNKRSLALLSVTHDLLQFGNDLESEIIFALPFDVKQSHPDRSSNPNWWQPHHNKFQHKLKSDVSEYPYIKRFLTKALLKAERYQQNTDSQIADATTLVKNFQTSNNILSTDFSPMSSNQWSTFAEIMRLIDALDSSTNALLLNYAYNYWDKLDPSRLAKIDPGLRTYIEKYYDHSLTERELRNFPLEELYLEKLTSLQSEVIESEELSRALGFYKKSVRRKLEVLKTMERSLATGRFTAALSPERAMELLEPHSNNFAADAMFDFFESEIEHQISSDRQVFYAAMASVALAITLSVISIFSQIWSRRNNRLLSGLIGTDPLTGVPNRLALDSHTQAVFNSSRQGDTAVMVLDLDDFKRVNDDFGHLCGDVALRVFADVCASSIREGEDFLARLGGDEFIIVLSKGDNLEQKAQSIATRILITIGDTPISAAGHNLKLTSSVGIAIGCRSLGFDKLYHRADKALYYSKNEFPGNYHIYQQPFHRRQNSLSDESPESTSGGAIGT